MLLKILCYYFLIYNHIFYFKLHRDNTHILSVCYTFIMCTLADDAKKFPHNGLPGGIHNDSSSEEHNEANYHSRRPRGTKILVHGCCAGLSSKTNLLDAN